MTQFILILAIFTGPNYTSVSLNGVIAPFASAHECDAAGQKAKRDLNNPATWVSYSCVARTPPS